MALNLKNPEVEELAAEVARLGGTTKTEAIRLALLEKRKSLQRESSAQERDRAWRFLTEQLWPSIPEEAKRPVTKEEEDEILGYGPDGYPI